MEQYTVLFVDDEPFILKALLRLFRGDPIAVVTANSAEEALELLKHQPVQLLVTDNMMPGMTGVELTRKVKDLYPDTLRIILSGQSDMEAVLKAVNEGEAYRFILKPWADLDLKATVNIALAQYKLMQDNRRLMAELEAKSALLKHLQQKHPDLFREIEPYKTHELTLDDATAVPLMTPAGEKS
ncbi:MAG: response regulator [Candidatus Zixiibacteriota bacterium]